MGIDLRKYSIQVVSHTKSNQKQLIIDVLSLLLNHIEEIIKSSFGAEKKKQQFRLSSIKKGINSLLSYEGEITSGDQARELPGIGKGIGDRIDEIIRTETLLELSNVRAIDGNTKIIEELTSITGIGEVNAKKFLELGVKGLDDLRDKAFNGIIKLTHHIQIGLKYYHDIEQKIPFDEIVELGQILKTYVKQIYPQIIVEICGSHRRQKSLSGDIDVLMTTPSIISETDLIKTQTRYLKDIVKVLKENSFIVDDLTSFGDTKYMGICIHPKIKIGRRIDIRLVTYDSFYPAILYFTGSMMLNKLMRTIALQKQYTLNEYGLYHIGNDKKIPVQSEKEIFDLLDLLYLEPNEREIDE